MKTKWDEQGVAKEVVSPVSLIISAFAPVEDVPSPDAATASHRRRGRQRADRDRSRPRQEPDGGSIFAQVTQQVGDTTPDVDDAEDLKRFFNAIQSLNAQDKLLATTTARTAAQGDGEMAFAGHAGASLNVDMLTLDPNPTTATRRTGRSRRAAAARSHAARAASRNSAPSQVRATDRDAVLGALRGPVGVLARDRLGQRSRRDRGTATRRRSSTHRAPNSIAHGAKWRIARLRDNPRADAEYDALLDAADPGISPVLSFDPADDIAAPFIATGARPRVAILASGRELASGNGLRVRPRGFDARRA